VISWKTCIHSTSMLNGLTLCSNVGVGLWVRESSSVTTRKSEGIYLIYDDIKKECDDLKSEKYDDESVTTRKSEKLKSYESPSSLQLLQGMV